MRINKKTFFFNENYKTWKICSQKTRNQGDNEKNGKKKTKNHNEHEDQEGDHQENDPKKKEETSKSQQQQYYEREKKKGHKFALIYHFLMTKHANICLVHHILESFHCVKSRISISSCID